MSEIEHLAASLGGGWRIEREVMPIVVLTEAEATRLVNELQELRDEITELERELDDTIKNGPRDEY